MSSSPRRWKPIVWVAALCVATTPIAFAAPASAAPQTSIVASGSDWNVETIAGGYIVTLTLDQPLEIRSNAPTLLVDGTVIGSAVESADGLTLSVVTNDPIAASASSVTQGWEGESDAPTSRSRIRSLAAPVTPSVDALLDVDPSTKGAYSVTRADYDLGDQAIDLAGIGGIKGELTGAIYLPAESTTPAPVVLFLHGRHTSCSGGTANPLRWPCNPDQIEVPSYLGYDDSAEVLASNGYAVVSISANAINANDNQLADDRGALARGQLVLDSLDLLAKANAGATPGFDAKLIGKLDLGHIGIMGHSRGGEGVVRAALLNAERETPYNIEAVLPLAPTDFGRMTLPDVPTAVILPYCDGDVVNLQGQHFIDDSRNAFDDSVLRSSVLIMGTNHNFFNTIWTPSIYPYSSSDDWRAQDRNQVDPDCGYGTAPSRLTDTEQRSVGTAYISGFFRLTMGKENQFLPLFDGSESTVPSAGRADVRVTASLPSADALSVASLDAPTTKVRTAGGATAAVCASLSARPVAGALPYCASTLTSSQAPHWTPATYATSVPASPMLRMQWTAPTGEMRVALPAGSYNVSGYTDLSLKIAPDETIAGAIFRLV